MNKFKTKRDKAKKIIAEMIKCGIKIDCVPSDIDNWSDDDVDYLIANYGPHYLGVDADE